MSAESVATVQAYRKKIRILRGRFLQKHKPLPPPPAKQNVFEIGSIAVVLVPLLIWTANDQKAENRKTIRDVFEYCPWTVCKQWYAIARNSKRIFGLFCDIYPIWRNKQLAVSESQLISNYRAVQQTNKRMKHLYTARGTLPSWLRYYCKRIFTRELDWDKTLVAMFPSQCPVCQVTQGREDEIARLSSPGSVKLAATNNSTFEINALLLGPPDTPYTGGLFVATVILTTGWPFKPPHVLFRTPIFHCNIDHEREIDNVQMFQSNSVDGNWSPATGMHEFVMCLLSMLGDPDEKCISWPKTQHVNLDGGEETVAVTDPNPPPIRAKVVYQRDKAEYEREARSWTQVHALAELQRQWIPSCKCANLLG
jgi:ubiquitin-conjugating enzyme E2 D/E